MKSLVWFRNDFRMDDNPALRAACSQSEEVHGVFIYSENQFKLHNESNCKIEFIIEKKKDNCLWQYWSANWRCCLLYTSPSPRD